MEFRENLKTIRESKNMTQQQMANLLRITRQAYAKYEQGKREPNLSTIRLIKEILDCSYDDLLK